MITHTTSASATCRLRWISGSASTTMVVSTAVIRTPAMSTIIARPVRRDCPPAPSIPDGAGLFLKIRGKVTYLA
jgi:hypothetical protein